jgi:branched-chain amino acid transport system ATP-binding protein
VTAGYGDSVVLRDVDLGVPPASVVALIGPNGSGKTTALRVLSGLLPCQGGAVLLNGTDVTGSSPDELVAAGVCHVPEGRGIFPSLAVAENLTLFSPAGLESEARERAVAAFPKLGQRLKQVAGSLSGGEQQMLALARAYEQTPSFVLLDEVSMGLAPKIVDEIYESLHRLAAQGTALLVVEQFVTKALAIAEYVYLLNRGAIVFAGEPAEFEESDVFAKYLGVAASSSARRSVRKQKRAVKG